MTPSGGDPHPRKTTGAGVRQEFPPGSRGDEARYVAGEVMTDRPLMAASNRLKGKPGRPKKAESGHVQGTSPVGRGINGGLVEGTVAVTAIAPRLLDLEGSAAYLGVSAWTVRDLEAAGTLHRVRIPLPNNGELRKLLFDREDLDRLIEAWKDNA